MEGLPEENQKVGFLSLKKEIKIVSLEIFDIVSYVLTENPEEELFYLFQEVL